MDDENAPPPEDPQTEFAFAVLFTGFLGIVGLGLGILLNAPVQSYTQWSLNDILIGIIATLPLAAFLFWFTKSDFGPFIRLRQSQIDLFAQSSIKFTPARIIALSLAAGIGEEMLFRGFLQNWLSGFAPPIVAILIASLVFGLLHARTALYAVIATAIGVYLGVLYVATGSLLTPITTHAVYDWIAFEYIRRFLDDHPAHNTQ